MPKRIRARQPTRASAGPAGPAAKAQFATFLARFTPDVASEARKAIARMRQIVPGASELVYDNYNALVVGFAPNERPSDAVFSLAIFPRWVTLCFLQNGPELPDPQRILRGNGNVVRHVRLTTADDLDAPVLRTLIDEALKRADVPFAPDSRSRIVIRMISKNQRPRRPAAGR
jgi:Domain of unknown function (DU1801)